MSKDFYLRIEEGVRDAVRVLRNNGINTTCSCHHEGYIEAASIDAETESSAIFTSMAYLGIDAWEANLTLYHTEGVYMRYWKITSPSFKEP